MENQKMCALHALMNAKQLSSDNKVKIIFEGKSVTLPLELEESNNPIYSYLKQNGNISGICKACSAVFDVLEKNETLELKILDDMNGHAGMKSFREDNFEVIVF